MEERSSADRVLAKTLERKKPLGMNEWYLGLSHSGPDAPRP
jgi:hypothetical protein